MDRSNHINLPNKDFTFQSIDNEILDFWEREDIFK